jgi:hypothetical protein
MGGEAVEAVAAGVDTRVGTSRPAGRGSGADCFSDVRRAESISPVPPIDPDLDLRQEAVAHARRLTQAYDDLVPLTRLREGFVFQGERVSYGSF